MMNTDSTIALLGCGYTLSRVAAMLQPESLVLVVRSEETAARLRQTYRHVVQVSLEDEAAVSEFFQNYPSIQTVVDSVPPLFATRIVTEEDVESALTGVRNCVNALKNSSCSRLIYLSTTGVYGVTDGTIVDEATRPEPTNPRAKARLESERLYQSESYDTIVLRISAIYGPGRGIGTALRAGRFSLAGNGAGWSNRIQVEDLARCIHKAIISTEVPGLLNVSDGSYARQVDVVDFYCREFGCRYPESTSLELLKQSGSYTRLSNQRIDSNLMHSFLGTLQYPSYRDGAHTEFE